MSPSPKDDVAIAFPLQGLLPSLPAEPGAAEPLLKALGSAFALAKEPAAIQGAERQVRHYLDFLDRALAAMAPGSSRASTAPTPGRSEYADGRVRTGLSARELEIVRLVASGQTVGHIAKVFNISAHTVRNHLKACYRKVGVHTQIEIVNYAFAHGLVSAP